MLTLTVGTRTDGFVPSAPPPPMRRRYACSPIGSLHGTGEPGGGGGGKAGGDEGGGVLGGVDGGTGGALGGGDGEHDVSMGKSVYCNPSIFCRRTADPIGQLGPTRT